MIFINNPTISQTENEVKITSLLEFDDHNKQLWYQVSQEYKPFLVTENLDAFLVGILFLALKEGQDITLKGPVSRKLYYNLTHYVIPALCLANSRLHKIKIQPTSFNEENLNIEQSAGTGLSCGVDSFATYYDHIDEKGSYKIKHFAFFNAGSHGSGGEKTSNLFEKRFLKAKSFADSIDRKIIKIDSNISEVLNMKFQTTNTLRNASCVLILQKLFSNYYIASKNRFDYFELHEYDTQDYDSLVLNLLSTESTSFHSAVANLSRVERTNLISKFPPTYNFLDVCTSGKKYRNGVNCSQCNKCLRTSLTLDLLGKLNLYQNVFHIEKYLQLKNSYIGHVILNRKKDQINKDLYALLKEKNAIKYSDIIFSKLSLGLKGRIE